MATGYVCLAGCAVLTPLLSRWFLSAWINTRRRFLNTSKPFSYQQTCLFGKVTHRFLKELFPRIVEMFKLTDNRFDFNELPYVFRNPNQTCWGIRQTLKERSILWSLYFLNLECRLKNSTSSPFYWNYFFMKQFCINLD